VIGAIEDTVIIETVTITSVTPSSGYLGHSLVVTINGTNLNRAETVNFGSGITTDSFTVDSPTQITANITVPGRRVQGSRDLSVTHPGGTATLVDAFQIYEEEGPDYYLVMNLLGTRQRVETSQSGRLRETLEVTSVGGALTVTIPAGTKARRENGSRLTTLSVSENDNPPPSPENKNIIGLTYNFEPDGATFDPPITLTSTYDPNTLPEGVEEEDLVVAFYDEATGEWVECECTCDPETNCITACVCHFTDFAIIAPVPPPPPPSAKPVAFSLSKLIIQPLEVEPEEMVTITVSVANTGGTAGSYTVVLDINGAEEQTQSISIAAGGTKQVDLTINREEPSDYVVEVGALEGSFTVTVPPALPETPVAEPSLPQPKPSSPPTEPPALVEKGGVNWYIIGTILGIAILMAIFIPIWIRRRRYG